MDLEKVQRKFTRLINDIGTLTYGERLKSLTLTTLAERRMRGDLIEAFKIIRGFVNYGQNLFNLSISGLNILSKITKTTSPDRRDFFSERILKYWNILPKNVKMSESVNSFKANLESYKKRSVADIYHNSTGHYWEVQCRGTSWTGLSLHHTWLADLHSVSTLPAILGLPRERKLTYSKHNNFLGLFLLAR